MKHLLLSLAERVLSRLPSALLMVLLAVYLDPLSVGLYAWMILALTFTQAAIDVPLRQVSIEAISTVQGGRFIAATARAGAIWASLLLVVVLLAVSFLNPTGPLPVALELAPLVLVPLATLSGIGAVARLQAAARWGVLARSQAIAAFGGFLVTLPFLVWTESLVAAAAQPLLAEGLNMVLCRRAARGPSRRVADGQPEVDSHLRSEWRGARAYSLLGWAQGQADRLFVGAFAGASLLGGLSYASALGRTGGEAAINAGVNVLRTRVSREQADHDVRAATDSAALRMIAITTLGAGAVWALSAWALPAVVSAAWTPALAAAPLVALSVVASAVTWHMTVVLVLRRRTKRALPARATGIALGALVAVAAVQSLTLAAVVIVVRELLVMLWLACVLGKLAPWRSAAAAALVCAVGVGMVVWANGAGG